MHYEFANGTNEQKKLWGEAAHLLLHLPFASINLTVVVEFVDTGEVADHGHTDLAVTTYTYGHTTSTTRVRNDAPSFGTQRKAMEAAAAAYGLEYDPTKFFYETAAHEMGHSAFAVLPEQLRLEVVALFGLDTDDIKVLAPEGTPWQDHVIEGIAETFKEAFLPARFRVFPNRTRRRIPYGLFPAFRKIFRAGLAASARFTYVYGDEYPWKVDLGDWDPFIPTYQNEHDDEAFVFYQSIPEFTDCWGVDMSQFAESGLHPFSIRTPGGETT